jgi:hypothetical protein
MKKWRKVPTRRIEHGSLYELRLSAVAVGWNYETPRDLIRDFRTKVASDNMQAQVYPRRTASRRQNRTCIDVEHVRLNMDLWVARPERVNIAPVCRRAFAVQQPCRSQHEDARANRN